MLKIVEELGDSNRFLSNLRFSPEMLEKIGGIVVVSGNIEYTLEQAFLALSEGQIKGKIPGTITGLIEEFRRLNSINPTKYNNVIEQWCDTAPVYFNCRNSIFHGNAFPGGGEFIWFAKALPIDGVKRKYNFSDFHADLHTLSLFLNAGTLLSRVITIVNLSLSKPMDYDEATLMSAVQNARSTCWELNDLATAVNNEKY